MKKVDFDYSFSKIFQELSSFDSDENKKDYLEEILEKVNYTITQLDFIEKDISIVDEVLNSDILPKSKKLLSKLANSNELRIALKKYEFEVWQKTYDEKRVEIEESPQSDFFLWFDKPKTESENEMFFIVFNEYLKNKGNAIKLPFRIPTVKEIKNVYDAKVQYYSYVEYMKDFRDRITFELEKYLNNDIPRSINKINITEQYGMNDITRIFIAMKKAGIISTNTQANQIANIFFSDPIVIDNFVRDYNTKKSEITNKDRQTYSNKLFEFTKSIIKQSFKEKNKKLDLLIEHIETLYKN